MIMIVSLLFFVILLIFVARYLIGQLRLIDETNRAISHIKNQPVVDSVADQSLGGETIIPPSFRDNQIKSQAISNPVVTDQGEAKPHYTLLKILVPKNNAKSPLAAEHMFAALHGIYRKVVDTQERFSFEIAATTQTINFFMLVPTYLRDFIEGQVYAHYPTVDIMAVPDYSNINLEHRSLVGCELTLTKNDIFPIKTVVNFEVDPLAGITGVLSKIEDGEILAIQAVLSPIDDAWQKEGLEYVRAIKEGKDVTTAPSLGSVIKTQSLAVLKEIGSGIAMGIAGTKPPEKKDDKKEIKLSGPEEIALKGIESKVVKLGYSVSIRLIAIGPSATIAQTRIDSALGAFKQFNTNHLNSFDVSAMWTDASYLRMFRSRKVSANQFRLNVEEIASLFHFPDESVQTPNIDWAGSKLGEPPQNLPLEGVVPADNLTTFGLTSFRNRRQKFGLKVHDRRLHTYIIGKTGTGKSTLIENMIFDDICEGRGVAVVDPHGELIEHILRFIPEQRIDDVVYFNPDDRDYPLAFNLLESIDDDMRNIVASGLMSIFTKLWANVWSARMEYILRNAILAILEVPDATLLSIMRLLSDDKYRGYVESILTDPVVKDFFINEYDRYDPKFRQEAIAPIQNKVGQFLSSTTIRNIVGQPKSTFDLTEIMDQGKIFLVNLSIGRIGEDNSKLLGSMMITKIQLAAMGRAKLAEVDRRDFYLYVDEFQNFATDSFATILSEARKYHLSLVLVNQYIAQIPEVVADAIFGNVGTMISFRLGATDADKMVKELAPVFDANDLVNLPNRQIYVKMAIDGVTSQAFSAHTLPPRGVVVDKGDQIIIRSRQKYSHDRFQVESMINSSTTQEVMSDKARMYEEIKKYPFIINGTYYKEFSAKGGEKWYFGQLPEDVEAEKGVLDLPSELDVEKVESASSLDATSSGAHQEEQLLPSHDVAPTGLAEIIDTYEATSKRKRKRKRKRGSGLHNSQSISGGIPFANSIGLPAMPTNVVGQNTDTYADQAVGEQERSGQSLSPDMSAGAGDANDSTDWQPVPENE